MALGRSLCVSMLVAATPAAAAGEFIEGVYLQQAGNSASYYRCEGMALP